MTGDSVREVIICEKAIQMFEELCAKAPSTRTILFVHLHFCFCIIFFLFKWLCWMVTLLWAAGLERITRKYIYFNVC